MDHSYQWLLHSYCELCFYCVIDVPSHSSRVFPKFICDWFYFIDLCFFSKIKEFILFYFFLSFSFCLIPSVFPFLFSFSLAPLQTPSLSLWARARISASPLVSSSFLPLCSCSQPRSLFWAWKHLTPRLHPLLPHTDRRIQQPHPSTSRQIQTQVGSTLTLACRLSWVATCCDCWYIFR